MNIFGRLASIANLLTARVFNTPSLLLERPAPPPWRKKPHHETREDRKIVRWWVKASRQESMKLGTPKLTGARLGRTIEQCSPKHLTITPKQFREETI